MRAIAILEGALIVWIIMLLGSLMGTFMSEGFIAMVFKLAEGKGILLTVLLIAATLTDMWRDKRRDRLIQKGKLEPNQLF
ncbi:hypothetical protein DFO70_104216 [Cytobacillus firmus]|uniref:Uncharacterized protein n=2 Tax=Cytobacillus TaxID=2675230 RepID=A0A366JYG6_CYTFI|nr:MULTISPECIES: hypothetical protein [Cytobacillus]RBP94575.1 hypothetical protein DFO70_104216 [Cytobacillus firmus]TDX43321.1 hypothetical protein DFO72_105218 [Cytobacillus oceanisediminis]